MERHIAQVRKQITMFICTYTKHLRHRQTFGRKMTRQIEKGSILFQIISKCANTSRLICRRKPHINAIRTGSRQSFHLSRHCTEDLLIQCAQCFVHPSVFFKFINCTATKAAVSVRKRLSPNVILRKPAACAARTSSTEKSPSGPISTNVGRSARTTSKR